MTEQSPKNTHAEFDAEMLLHDVTEAMVAIGVLMRCMANRPPDVSDRIFVQPVFAILEDTDMHLRDLRKIIEEDEERAAS